MPIATGHVPTSNGKPDEGQAWAAENHHAYASPIAVAAALIPSPLCVSPSFASPLYTGTPLTGATASAMASASLKVFAQDQEEEEVGDDEWGDFVQCATLKGEDSNQGQHHEQLHHHQEQKHQQQKHQVYEQPLQTQQQQQQQTHQQNTNQKHRAYDEEEYSRPRDLPQRMETNETRPASPSLGRLLLSRLTSLGANSSPSGPSSMANSSSLPATPRTITSALSRATGTTPNSPRNYDSYDVTFGMGPIGLELETDWYGRQAVVKGFQLVNGQDGPAKTCGVIRIGDVLTAINGDSCLELGFSETLEKLKLASRRGTRTLHFKSLEAAGDLSVYNHDADILTAKKLIHQHKEQFYRAPPRVRTLAGKGDASATASGIASASGSASASTPPPPPLLLGCVERLIGEHVTAFNLHREDTGEFVMASSCVNDRTGVFVFHTLQDSHLRTFADLPQSEDAAVYLGQMVPNFLGTEFTLLDHQQKRRNELGFIEFSTNVLGRVPNALQVAFPKQSHASHTGDDQEEDDEEEEERREVGEQEEKKRDTNEEDKEETTTAARFSSLGFSSMMDRNGTISARFKRRKQKRSTSLVERLRRFSLDDFQLHLEFGGGLGDGDGSSRQSLTAAWHDDDNHATHTRRRRASIHEITPTLASSTSYGALEQEDYDSDLLVFETRRPSWNDALGAWTLNFHGRVKEASKKNFLIVPEQGNAHMEAAYGEDTTVLRFGKISSTRFALDYQAPLSPFLALAIACSAFSHKIAVT